MRRIAAILLSLALATGAVPGWDDPAADYLAARERLAPASARSLSNLRQLLGTGDFPHIELVGDVSGKASAAPTSGDKPTRTLMLTLEDGSSISLHAGEEIDALPVGSRVAVIASAKHTSSCDELTLESWVHEWDLPREPEPAPADEEPTETPAPPALVAPAPTPVPVDGRPPSLATTPPAPAQVPRPSASNTVQADAVQIWTDWVLGLNPKLTEEQALNIVRWVLYYSQEYDVNHKLVFALIKWESWYKPGCVSHAGAIGLMQLMPGTARSLGVNPRNVQQNIQGGTRYLAEQLANYRDRDNYERVILALACYNAGPNAVSRAGHCVPNIRETQSYVKKVSQTFYELYEAGMP